MDDTKSSPRWGMSFSSKPKVPVTEGNTLGVTETALKAQQSWAALQEELQAEAALAPAALALPPPPPAPDPAALSSEAEASASRLRAGAGGSAQSAQGAGLEVIAAALGSGSWPSDAVAAWSRGEGIESGDEGAEGAEGGEGGAAGVRALRLPRAAPLAGRLGACPWPLFAGTLVRLDLGAEGGPGRGRLRGGLGGRLEALACLEALEALVLRGCGGLAGSLADLAGCRRLGLLDLEGCAGVGGPLAGAEALPRLRLLNLRETGVDVRNLKALAV